MPTRDVPGLDGPTRPLGAPDIPQFFLPGAGAGTYAPRLYGAARVRFAEGRRKSDPRRVAFLLPLDAPGKVLDWDAAMPTDVMPEALLREPPVAASYAPLPPGSMQVPTFRRWAKGFDRWLARTQRLPRPAAADGADQEPIRPKRGGVSVELVAIVWQLS